MMDPESPTPAPKANWELKEVRYSLRDLLKEVASEQDSGSFGMEKLRQQDIGKMFKKRPRKRRDSNS
ncbi:hypothetical protein [Synoicihabitans lomoniglobus]|uniref:Uncharacterized protein n=1 Tax=Synoicihabitans lomoniglobus TaxID=2909285 RepID=A0AAE9ZWF1_9BACT|nr:hypothetical protein [Opitutaceae bacterium LMO-M01]WED64661.1 hypothetical protein PXH66_20145 [Opitutaceae bacterium LMO-M01]